MRTKTLTYAGRDYTFAFKANETMVNSGRRLLILTDHQPIVPGSSRMVPGPWRAAEICGRWEAHEFRFIADTNANQRTAPLP